jgi:tryptophan synthase alpha chain
LALALIDEGAAAIEIGVPFSDPMADGPAIQLAAARALAGGATLRSSLALAREIKRQRPEAIVVLFTYFNPIYRLGAAAYAGAAREAGVDATLVVDLPPEEAADHVRAHREAKLGTIFLASPTSSEARQRQVAELSTGFIYAVSRLGTTGEASALSGTLASEVACLRKNAGGLPIAVGFGISTASQAAEVARIADAVVIGSRFVSLIAESATAGEAEAQVRALARECVAAIARIQAKA